MSRFSDNLATSHRSSAAVFAAIGLAGILVWALVLKQEQGRFLQTENVMATIREIKKFEHKYSSRYTGTSLTITYVIYLTLPEGKDIKLRSSLLPPKIGSQVPVLVDVYENGSKFYYYNHMEWQLLQALQ